MIDDAYKGKDWPIHEFITQIYKDLEGKTRKDSIVELLRRKGWRIDPQQEQRATELWERLLTGRRAT